MTQGRVICVCRSSFVAINQLAGEKADVKAWQSALEAPLSANLSVAKRAWRVEVLVACAQADRRSSRSTTSSVARRGRRPAKRAQVTGEDHQ